MYHCLPQARKKLSSLWERLKDSADIIVGKNERALVHYDSHYTTHDNH